MTKASDTPTTNRFWLYVTLQLAVLTVVSFPVFNAQVLTNPDWTGDLSQYITLATLAGGGALAATPTLRAHRQGRHSPRVGQCKRACRRSRRSARKCKRAAGRLKRSAR